MSHVFRPGQQRDLHSLRFSFGVCLLPGIIFFAIIFPVSADGLNLGGATNMGAWSPNATRYETQQRVCAWSSTIDRFYRVIASTAENPESFQLVGDLGDRVRFDVRWRDVAASTNWERLIAGMPSSRRYEFAIASNCQGNDTQLQIRLSKKDADQAPGGRYSSTLTITLVAE